MSLKSGCLYLILVLVSAWTDDLQAGTFVTVSPTGTPLFGQEMYPIGRRHVLDMENALKQLPLSLANEKTVADAGSPFELVLTPLDETTPQVVQSGDLCYRLQSLRW
jgi:hypothetical protein